MYRKESFASISDYASDALALGLALGLADADLGERQFRVEVHGLPDERLRAVEEPVVVPVLVEALREFKEVGREFGRVEIAARPLDGARSAKTDRSG